jgi:phosphoenolpyruvate carboxylase
VIASSKYANPEIGRRNLETLVAATLEATLLHPTQRAPKRLPRRRGRSSADAASPPTAAGLRDAGLHRLLLRRHADPRDRRAEHRLAPRPTSEGSDPGLRAQLARDRKPARDPLELQLGPEPRGAAGLVRLRQRGRGLPRRARPRRQPSARSSAAHAPAVAVLPHAAVQPGHGARQERPAHRRALRRTRRGPRARPAHLRPAAPSGSAPSTHWRSITGESERLQSNPALARSIAHRFPYLDPLNHLQVELLRRYRNRREGAAGVDRLQRGIHLSINGIAAGLRNTG